jgi:glutathionylspermidine synthase
MKHIGQSSMGGFSDYNEYSIQNAAKMHAWPDIAEQNVSLDTLVEQGFAREEAERLLLLREHLYENPEILQRMAEDNRLLFARWLYEQGEMYEDC